MNEPRFLRTQNFTKLRMHGGIYVDKTDMVGLLARQRTPLFLVRPRRFGKSLLVSTLASLFSSGLEFFRGLKIEKEWEKTPGFHVVIDLDFSNINPVSSGKDLERELAGNFNLALRKYGLALPSLDFAGIRSWLAEQPAEKLILLIDEYDSPLNAAVDEKEKFDELVKTVQAFFSLIQANTSVFRFIFITGIIDYTYAGVFSGLNSLKNLTFDPRYSSLLGFTSEEIQTYCSDYVAKAASHYQQSQEEFLKFLKAQYVGYCFNPEIDPSSFVASPWSLVNFFTYKNFPFTNYWFQSGGQPAVLLNATEADGVSDPLNFGQEHVICLEDFSASAQGGRLERDPLLLMTGYLTLKKSIGEGRFAVGYPNREVENSFARLYLKALVPEGKFFPNIGGTKIYESIKENDVKKFVEGLNEAFGNFTFKAWAITTAPLILNLVHFALAFLKMNVWQDRTSSSADNIVEFIYDKTHWGIGIQMASSEKEAEKKLREGLKQMAELKYGLQDPTPALKRLCLVFSKEKREFIRFGEL